MRDFPNRRDGKRGNRGPEAEWNFRTDMTGMGDMEHVLWAERRHRTDRRRTPSPGHVRISMVGWICRREKSRRRSDPEPTEC